MENDLKLQSIAVTEDWKKFSVILHPEACDHWNSVIDGFPVNHPKLLSSTNQYITLNTEDDYYDRWNSQLRDRKTQGKLMRISTERFFEMTQEKMWNSFDAQWDFIRDAYISCKSTKKSTEMTL